ncbi:hypothetical protein V6N11_077519 [Hibiscus sabdariffa]|uniref:Uncharacterized protein n=1 Tax=Hibiscus sabdariffa TaxID=183260 RepID=A0ABR2TDY6_9ROSI
MFCFVLLSLAPKHACSRPSLRRAPLPRSPTLRQPEPYATRRASEQRHAKETPASKAGNWHPLAYTPETPKPPTAATTANAAHRPFPYACTHPSPFIHNLRYSSPKIHFSSPFTYSVNSVNMLEKTENETEEKDVKKER